MIYTPPAGDAVDFELAIYTPPAGDAVDFELAPAVLSPFLMGFGMSGKLGKSGDPDPLGVLGIYQMRMTRRGKVPIKMKFYQPSNAPSAAQLAVRQKFADGMAAWQALTPAERLAYNKSARKRQMFGWGYFLREFFRNN